MNKNCKVNSSKMGFLVGSFTLLMTFFSFPVVFGETPVNVMNLGSTNGEKNYLINILSYMVIGIIISIGIGIFSSEKLKWIKGAIRGIGTTLLLITILLFSYFEIFWRGKM